jgi:hypothetical protein
MHGVHVDYRRISHFVMVHIKSPDLNQKNLLQTRMGIIIYVYVRKRLNPLIVMDRTAGNILLIG